MDKKIEELKMEIEKLRIELDQCKDCLKESRKNEERLDFHSRQLWQMIDIVTNILNGQRGYYNILDLETQRNRKRAGKIIPYS